MMDGFHSTERFGVAVPVADLANPQARSVAAYLEQDFDSEARIHGCRRDGRGIETIVLEVDVERPQRPAADIGYREVLAIGFAPSRRHPLVMALRRDFPDTPHQNPTYRGEPRSLCIDERPWDVAAADWTAFGFLQRVRWWLAKAACGGLADIDQDLDPLLVATGPDLLIPSALFGSLGSEKPYVITHVADTEDGPHCLHLREAQEADRGKPYEYVVLPFVLPVQAARSLRLPPASLADLMADLLGDGFDLASALTGWIRGLPHGARSHGAKLLLMLAMGISREGNDHRDAMDLKAFLIRARVGDIGEALGVLAGGPGDTRALLLSPAAANVPRLASFEMAVLPVSTDFDAALARLASGVDGGDGGKVLLIGAGAIGSHVASILGREGRHTWAIADEDWLRPHNLARHVLDASAVGHSKARALAAHLGGLLGSPVEALCDDVLDGGEVEVRLRAAAEGAVCILDASASVPVARHVSDADLGPVRRMSVFFNPLGSAVVLLSEDRSRDVRLDSLEGRYYREILRNPLLHGHLAEPPRGFRHAAACRALSARIPESQVAILSGLAARGVTSALSSPDPGIGVWTLQPDGAVGVVRFRPDPVRRSMMGDWRVILDEGLVMDIEARRHASLPNETGGILVGVFDATRQVICIVDALPPSPDSEGSVTAFVRGTQGVEDRLGEIARRTGGMVRYIGEWHTHPRGGGSLPSETDVEQLLLLRSELRREGLPATMLIAGDDGVRVVQLTE